MSKYEIEGSTVDTTKAINNWPDKTEKNKRGYVSKSTGSTIHRETLYRTRRGRFYLEHKSKNIEETPWAEWISPERAMKFLQLNDYIVPEYLIPFIHDNIQSEKEIDFYIREDIDEIEIAQHLADMVSDTCCYCPAWHGKIKPISPCPQDEQIEMCLKIAKAGSYKNFNWCIDENHRPDDYRHWSVAKKMSKEELANILRKNA